jgi:hypothetical protein
MSTTAFNPNMFESIKSALTKQNESPNTKYKDFLKTEPGNTYTVRLLPNIKNPAKTFLHYYNYGWNSLANGQFVSVVSPATWDQRDPIAEERYRVLRNGTEEDKKKATALTRRENWMVNVYVVNDPVNPDNNGQIKVLRFGRQLHKIIMDAISGEEAEEFGPKIFDLSPKGCSFRIKVERQGEYPTYVSSKFISPREIENLDEGDIKETYTKVYDLESYITSRSYEEIKELLDVHYHCKTDEPEQEAEVAVTALPKQQEKSEPIREKEVTEIVDESIESLLKGLES